VTSGSLPPGLALSSAGTVTGTPTTAGSSTFAVTCSNAAGSSSQSYTVTIRPANSVTATAVPALNPFALALLAVLLAWVMLRTLPGRLRR
jgi:MFS superfamily sulfate permease-like transporter